MRRVVLFFALSLAGLVHSQTAVAAQKVARQWGNAVHGLQMSLSSDPGAKGSRSTMQFTLQFRNVGQEKIVVTSGGGCGKMSSEATSAVNIILVDSGGKQHHLDFQGDGPPYQSACFGAISAVQFTLNSGELHSVILDLGKYVDLADSKSYLMARFSAGTYSLQAALRLPTAGKVFSNIVQVRFDSEFAAPLSDSP